MLFIYIMSLLSWYTIYLNKSSVIDISPVETVGVLNNNSSKTLEIVTVSNSEQVDSGDQEIDDWNIDFENNSDFLDNENDLDNQDDQYEEIIFQDNFDKEYRSWTEDNYLEE